MSKACASPGCELETAGNSKYCYDHRKEARARFKEMIRAQAEERKSRAEGFEKVWIDACVAGRLAGSGHTPTAMIVEKHTNQLDDSSPVEKSWTVSEGVCGFAWITIRPGNCAFANWLKAKSPGHTNKGYYGGLEYSILDYNQSYERKIKHAEAMAKVLQKAGIDATASGRLD
jgi:hypothetical protein